MQIFRSYEHYDYHTQTVLKIPVQCIWLLVTVVLKRRDLKYIIIFVSCKYFAPFNIHLIFTLDWDLMRKFHRLFHKCNYCYDHFYSLQTREKKRRCKQPYSKDAIDKILDHNNPCCTLIY